LRRGSFAAAFDELLQTTVPPTPTSCGADQAARHLAQLLK
jgi:hypothetical protein